MLARCVTFWCFQQSYRLPFGLHEGQQSTAVPALLLLIQSSAYHDDAPPGLQSCGLLLPCERLSVAFRTGIPCL